MIFSKFSRIINRFCFIHSSLHISSADAAAPCPLGTSFTPKSLKSIRLHTPWELSAVTVASAGHRSRTIARAEVAVVLSKIETYAGELKLAAGS